MKTYIYVVIIVFFISVCVSILINLQAKVHQINQWRFVIDDIIVISDACLSRMGA